MNSLSIDSMILESDMIVREGSIITVNLTNFAHFQDSGSEDTIILNRLILEYSISQYSIIEHLIYSLMSLIGDLEFNSIFKSIVDNEDEETLAEQLGMIMSSTRHTLAKYLPVIKEESVHIIKWHDPLDYVCDIAIFDLSDYY